MSWIIQLMPWAGTLSVFLLAAWIAIPSGDND